LALLFFFSSSFRPGAGVASDVMAGPDPAIHVFMDARFIGEQSDERLCPSMANAE
jgi:hypothetical protein